MISFDSIPQLCETHRLFYKESITIVPQNDGFLMTATPMYPLDIILKSYELSGLSMVTPKDSEAGLFLGDIHLFKEGLSAGVLPSGEFYARGEHATEIFLKISSLAFSLQVDATIRMVSDKHFKHILLNRLFEPVALPKMDDVFSPVEAGKVMVASGMVDSVFGNVSRFHPNGVLEISASGTLLDSLEGNMVHCSLDGECKGGTPSSEYEAHKRIAKEFQFITHGHPRSAVALSLVNPDAFGDIPVVSGAPGSGVGGLWETVPSAIKECGVVIVQGHGVFSASNSDFSDALLLMKEAEDSARNFFSNFYLNK
ncbi:class II aldolase/adducin family protein [bacterium]|nr:class II aldolase/adducin family protein [bacterium]